MLRQKRMRFAVLRSSPIPICSEAQTGLRKSSFRVSLAVSTYAAQAPHRTTRCASTLRVGLLRDLRARTGPGKSRCICWAAPRSPLRFWAVFLCATSWQEDQR
jgi:hypothetical protein